MGGFSTGPLNYLAKRAARSYTTSPVTSAPVANPRAQVTGQPVMLPGVEITASRSNTPAGTAQSKPSGVAQGKSSYDTNTLWG